MNVLSVNKFFWQKGGSESVFFAEMDLLEQNSHIVVPFSMQSKNNESSEYSKYFVREADYQEAKLKDKIRFAANIVYSLEAKRKMSELLADVEIDIAHFHIFQHQISPSVFGPIRNRNIPIILTLHDLKPICPNYKMYVDGSVCEKCKGAKFYNCFLNCCTKGSRLKSMVNTVEMYFHYAMDYYQNVDRYIAVSQFYRNKMIEFGFDADQVEYLPNFIDMDAYPFDNSDDGYALYFGRLSEEKGLDTLLDAASQRTEIPLVIAGAGPDESRLQKRVADEGLDHIRFVGYQSGESLKRWIAKSSFSIIPSRWYENCPMSVLESFALCTPVLGADIGGIPELINVGIDGLLFRSGDHNDLAEKMKEMWSKGRERKEMGRSGREKVGRQFAPANHYLELMRIYQSVSV